MLHINATGYAYRSRPLSQASRSQRLFGALARSFAALPKVPTAGSIDSLALSENDEASLAKMAAESSGNDLKGNVFEQLTEMGQRHGEESEGEEDKVLASEPDEMNEEEQLKSPTHSRESSVRDIQDQLKQAVLDDLNPIIPGQGRVGRKLRVGDSPPELLKSKQFTPSRSNTLPSNQSSPRPASFVSSPLPSRSSSPTRTEYNNEWPKPFTFTNGDLPRLHANLQARLLPFFGQKLGLRKVRLSVYPVLEPGTLWDKPLTTKVVTTTTGGAYKTILEVRSKDLRRLLEETEKGIESLMHLELRIVSELLEVDPIQDALNGGHFTGHQGLKPVASDDSETVSSQDGGLRVISDIDDTIKHSEVLGGTKKLFRNVFVRELKEVQVPGMRDWYQLMKKEGASFHYVSNSPWELWPVLRRFLSLAGYPTGSVTLKEVSYTALRLRTDADQQMIV